MSDTRQAQQHRSGSTAVQPVSPIFEGLCHQFKADAVNPGLIAATCQATVNTLQAARHNYQLMSPQAYRSWFDEEIGRIQAIAKEAAA